MAQREIHLTDGGLPSPSWSASPQYWHVPSFGAPGRMQQPPPPPPTSQFFTPPPPPPPPPRQSREQATRSALPTPTKGKHAINNQPSIAPAATPHKSPPKITNAHGNGNDGYFSTQSTMTILSPLSNTTKVTKTRTTPRVTEQAHFKKSSKASPRQSTDARDETLQNIDMLNYDFIQSCKCAKDLGRIIRMLAEQSDSPQLLRAARDRLQAVQGRKTPPPPPPPRTTMVKPAVRTAQNDKKVERQQNVEKVRVPNIIGASVEDEIAVEDAGALGRAREVEQEFKSPGKVFTDSTANISRITLGNTTLDSIDPSRTSLSLSYSPQSVCLRGLDLVDTPSRKGSNSPSSAPADRKLDTIIENSSPTNMTPSGNSYNERLTAEVKQLSGDAMHVETQRVNDHSSFIDKLKGLQKAKQQAESLVKKLETKVHVVSSEKEQAVKSIEHIQQERQAIQQELEDERVRFQRRNEETRQLELRMKERVTELQMALKEETERSKLITGAEKSLRMQKENELEHQRRRNTELNQLLRQTKENLERIKRTQDKFRADLIQAFGVSGEEAELLQNVPQTEFMATMAKKVQETRKENEVLRKELEVKQSVPNKVVQERDQLRDRIREVLRANQVLESDNIELGAKIEELSEEVISSRAFIDKLLKTSHETQANDWGKKEEQYQAAIRNYRTQIREQASTVSLELYKAAVDDSRRTQNELQNAERRISDLQNKLSSLDNARTPNHKKPRSNFSFRSPTDYLEKGLLSGDHAPGENLVMSPIGQSFDILQYGKKPKTPISQIRKGLHLTMGNHTSSTQKRSISKPHCSPIEIERLHMGNNTRMQRNDISPQASSPRVQRDKENADLIGMTISFQAPTGGLPTPDLKDHSPCTKDVDTFENRNQFETEPATSTAPMSMRKAVSADRFQQSPDAKENDLPLASPKNGSKSLRMRKARDYGGVKGLKSQLNKIRSPLGKPQRVALAERKAVVN